MTTSSGRDGGKKKARGSAARSPSRARPRRKVADRAPQVVVPDEPPALEPAVGDPPQAGPLPAIPLAAVETTFAARVPPPEAERPRPAGRRAIFLDVENTSRAQHLAHVIDHLGIDPWDRRTELVAVANWRVVGHEAARLLAQRGAYLVHSAPSTGVRDWSDLRIAVAAGIWLAAARPGDLIEIVSDDRAFDAVGDVAASMGISFRRLSYRRLVKEDAAEAPVHEERPQLADASRSRRRRRRRGRGPATQVTPPPRHAEPREAPRPPSAGAAPGHRPGAGRGGRGMPVHPIRPPAIRPPAEAPHTAPHDELVSVVRRLVEASPRRSVSIDTVANTLKSLGFERPPGSPRLITRLRRIREILVSSSGTITLAEDGGGEIAEAPIESRPPVEGPPDELDDDRQPAYLGGPEDELDLPEVDGNRKEPEAGGNRAAPPPGHGRRRRRRRRRGGQGRPAPGPQTVV